MHVIPIWRIKCMDCEMDPSATGTVCWHPEKGVIFSIKFPTSSSHMLGRYYRSPSAAGAGSIAEKQMNPRWIAETADKLPIKLFGLDELIHETSSSAGFSTEVKGNAWSASAEFTRECPLSFYDQTPPQPRSFFLGFRSFHWPHSEEISFPHADGMMETARRSISLSPSPDVKIYGANSLINLPDGAWLTNEDDEKCAALTSYPHRSVSGFVSFLLGRTASFFWRDTFVDRSILRRNYNGSERVVLRKLEAALPPLPLMYSSGPNLAQDVVGQLPSLFATYLRIHGKIDLTFILAPLWSAPDGLITDLLALACLSLERLAEEWDHYGENSRGKAKSRFWSEKQSCTIRSVLKKALDAITADAELTTAQIEIIKKRIDSQLGQQTNTDRLIGVFNALGLKLDDDEKACVENRNRALHGNRTLVDCGDMKQIDAELRRFDIIRMMIIRAVLSLLEYRGPYINYAARLQQRDFPIEWGSTTTNPITT